MDSFFPLFPHTLISIHIIFTFIFTSIFIFIFIVVDSLSPKQRFQRIAAQTRAARAEKEQDASDDEARTVGFSSTTTMTSIARIRTYLRQTLKLAPTRRQQGTPS